MYAFQIKADDKKSRGQQVFCCPPQLVEKVFFDKLIAFEKHTQTRKKPPSAYKGKDAVK